MNWQKIYKKNHTHYSDIQINNGIKDWEQRSYIFLGWLNNNFHNKDIKILDCGCGIGISGKILKENGYSNIIGIDSDEKELQHAKNIIKTYKMDCNNLKFPPKSFDIILALNIIEHLKNPEKFLDETKKVLKENGIIIISLPNSTNIRKMLNKTIDIPDHINHWDHKSFIKFMKNNSFNIIKIKPVGRFPSLLLCNTIMVLTKPVKIPKLK